MRAKRPDVPYAVGGGPPPCSGISEPHHQKWVHLWSTYGSQMADIAGFRIGGFAVQAPELRRAVCRPKISGRSAPTYLDAEPGARETLTDPLVPSRWKNDKASRLDYGISKQ
jgi:hypothetical protein